MHTGKDAKIVPPLLKVGVAVDLLPCVGVNRQLVVIATWIANHMASPSAVVLRLLRDVDHDVVVTINYAAGSRINADHSPV